MHSGVLPPTRPPSRHAAPQNYSCQVRESGDGMSLPAAVSGGGRKDEEKDERRMDNSFFPVERKVPFTCKK